MESFFIFHLDLFEVPPLLSHFRRSFKQISQHFQPDRLRKSCRIPKSHIVILKQSPIQLRPYC